MKRLVVLAVLASIGSASGQTLPAPQFATPATNDSSSHAATTAWVRAQNLLTANSDLSQATVRPTGATTARTQAARAADFFNVLDWGAVADGTTDIGPVLNSIGTAMGSAARSNVVYFPAGSYRIATPVTFNGVAPILQGQGFAQGPFQTGWTGTWIKVDTAGATPFTFSGTNARGAKVRDLAFYEIHPTPSAGWTPTANDYVFKVLNALGEVAFDNELFAGVNRGVYADNSGRLNIKDVQGQFYTTGIAIDDCYDIPRIERLHSWTFANSSPFVVAYQEAHADTILLKRVDGIFIGDLFTLGMYSALHLSSGANGVTTKAYVNSLYADFVNYGILIDGPGSDIQVSNMTSQNNDQTNSGATLPNGNAVWIDTTGVSMQISALYSKLTAGAAVEVDGNSNRVNIANLRANTYGTPGAGTPAVFVTDTGTNPSNQVYVGNKEQLQGNPPLVLFNSGTNGGRQRFVMMNDVGGPNQNEARAYSAVAGNAPQLAAIGGDANIDLFLNGKGTSGVRLQSSGQTVLRADNLNASTDDFLLRGGAGTMNWVAEGGDANIDIYLSPKGVTGGVRLQGAGNTVLRVDNPTASVDDLLVRGGVASMTLLPEGSEAAVDLYLAAKAAGTVRLQANGGTVLRVDNPGLGTSDVLVRSGTATMALTVEDPASSANLVLNPKGAGLVSTGNCPPATDNASNLACTSWVKGLGYATVSSLGPLATQPALASQPVVGTNAVGQIATAAVQGSGTKVQMAAGTATAGDCVKYDAAGNAVDAGSACGTGGGVGGLTALTGDVNASGSGSAVATLASVGSAGTYTKVTTDAKGRVVSGAAVAAADITAALGFAPLSPTSPSVSGTLTVGAINGLAFAGAASGAAPMIAATGGDASVDLALSADGPSGSARLLANGSTVLRVANAGAGNSDLLVQSGTGVASLTVESASSAAGLVLAPKGAGTISAPTALSSDNSTTVATTAFVRSLGYATAASPVLTGTTTVGGFNSVTLTGAATGGGPVIAALGGDAAVDLNLTSVGTGSVRIKSNGVNVLRTDSPGPGTSDLLVRSGAGTVALTLEDSGANASLTINPKGTGVVNVPTPATSSNGTTAATTASVRSVLPCVQPQAGRAYTAPFAALATVALPGTSANQTISALPLIVCGDRQVTALAFEITTATSSAFSARMGIYADSAGLPGGPPLADSGTLAVAANATGLQIAPFSGPTLHPGIYWLTLQTSFVATPAAVRAVAGGGLVQALGYTLTAGSVSAAPSGLTQTGTFGAPPNPFGAPSAYSTANIPLVWVQF